MQSTIQPHNERVASVWNSGGSGYDNISRGIADSIAHCVLRLDPQPGERTRSDADRNSVQFARAEIGLPQDRGDRLRKLIAIGKDLLREQLILANDADHRRRRGTFKAKQRLHRSRLTSILRSELCAPGVTIIQIVSAGRIAATRSAHSITYTPAPSKYSSKPIA